MHKRAFTLIELLVVTSIIALLIAILLPTLGSARKAARTVQCLANIKQLAAAVTMYADDDSGFLPPVRISPGVTNYPDGDIFSNILVRDGYYSSTGKSVGTSALRCPEGIEQNIEPLGWVSLSETSHRTVKHFMYSYPTNLDPSGSDPQPVDGVTVPTWYQLAGGNNDAWTFRWIRNDSDWDRRNNFYKLTDPSNRVLAAEQSNVNGGTPRYGASRIAARHGPVRNDGKDAGSHFTFFDGHAELLDTTEWRTGGDVSPIKYFFDD